VSNKYIQEIVSPPTQNSLRSKFVSRRKGVECTSKMHVAWLRFTLQEHILLSMKPVRKVKIHHM